MYALGGQNQNLELFTHIQKLIALRKEFRLLANKGNFRFLHIDDGVVYVKSEENRKCLVILNPYDKELKFTLPFALKGKKISDLSPKSRIYDGNRRFSSHCSTLWGIHFNVFNDNRIGKNKNPEFPGFILYSTILIR